MANIFTNLLDSAAGDLKDTNLKDYAHASRLFVQNFYRLAPKHGFLYFVRIRLNPNVADQQYWGNVMRDLELGMLVKSVELPKVQFEGEVLNVYNRKQPVYTKLNYNPIRMIMHDDNSGLAREFWQLYYQYHSADSYYGGVNATPNKQPIRVNNRYEKPTPIAIQSIAPGKNPSDPNFNPTSDSAQYGLDTLANEPLIKSIEIYQMSRKVFFLHTLVNPVIRSWDMPTLDYSATKTLEHNIQIEYEGIYFGKGKVTRIDPSNWTDLHYDLNPSPIGGLFGRSDGGLTGPYGLIQDGTDLFSDLQGIAENPNYDQRAALATLLKASRVISNATNLNTELAKQQIREATERSLSFVISNQVGGNVADLQVVKPNVETTTTATSKSVSPSSPTSATNSSGTPDSANNTVKSGT